MNEIKISVSSIKRELMILAIMFIIALFVNVYAIIVYGGQWIELISQLHIVIILSVLLYLLFALLRLGIFAGRYLVKRFSSR